MDDLRDYRFYADDMLHPSSVAIDYIWEQFSETYYEKETIQIIKEVQKIIQAENHRPIKPDTENHKKFIENLTKQKQLFTKKYSFVKFEQELNFT